MGVLEWYILFALTTSLTSLFVLHLPVLDVLSKAPPELNVVDYKYITLFTLFMLTLLIAPFMFLICIIPSLGMEFKIKLGEVLSQPD